jgi:hypothetical protein
MNWLEREHKEMSIRHLEKELAETIKMIQEKEDYLGYLKERLEEIRSTE